jgi:hypothetical protein
MGKISQLGGDDNWLFTPASKLNRDRAMIPGVNHDADYLSFGYWVQVADQADGSTKYGIGTFSGGSMPYGGADDAGIRTAIDRLAGTAKYEGPAAGMFVRKTADANFVGTPSASGEFTANAELTALFGESSVAEDDQYSISGTVSNFKGDGLDDSWEVDLKQASFRLDEAGEVGTCADDCTNTFNGATTGDGEWKGQFFGPAGDTDDPIKPSGVAGEFNAHFANGHVIGAFGAPVKN